MSKTIMLAGVLCALIATEIKAVTVELWPAERRKNNTVYLIGNEQNHLTFNISNRTNLGKHKIELPEKLVEPVKLTVDLPQKIKFLGARVFTDKDFSSEIVKKTVKHHGIVYNRYIIPLNKQKSNSSRIAYRVVKNKWYYYTTAWLKAPAEFSGKVYWKLSYGNSILAESSSNMQTIGVIDPKLKLPKRFKWHISAGLIYNVPDKDYRRFASFCKRLGINSVSVNYYKQYGKERIAAFQALRKAGVKNVANRSGSFGQYLAGSFRAKKTMAAGGLEVATAKAAAGINSEKERNLFKAVSPYFDAFNFDYEPAGPQEWPGWEDKSTIAAFAKKLKLKKVPSEKELKTKYRKAYFDYRMELLSRPVFALEKMLKAVKPMELAVEQGSGTNPHIDYKFYKKAVRWLGPMIYTSSPINYYQRLLATCKLVNPKKLMPVNSYGWTFAGVTRQSPQDMVMDTIGSAALGCGAIAHWPGLQWTDEGEFYGFYQALTMLAHIEDFYFDGKIVKKFSIKGMPFKSKKINLGYKTLDLSQPDWKNSLFYHQHKLKDETLITIMNFNQDYDAFVEISAKGLAGKYLVNPINKNYLKLSSNKTTIKVPKFSPGLWIVTTDSKRIRNCHKLVITKITSDFQSAKKKFLASSGKAKIQMGSKGNISVAYGQVEFGGKKTIALNITTPNQKLSFNKSGGRIISWIAGKNQFVANKSFSSDGFCMDLLWLPSGSRWGGDEIRDMRLVKCLNDGKKAVIEYSGEFKRAFPHLSIVKTYTIPADGKTVKVNIKLLNGTVLPITVAYWNHNVLPGKDYTLRADNVKYTEGGNSIFIPKNLPANFKQYICMPKKIKAKIGNKYTELDTKNNSTVTFKLPDNFLNVYRWASSSLKMCGSEWMTQPISIPAGTSKNIKFTISVSP
jgi:rhodanese-related sulfurtransferase